MLVLHRSLEPAPDLKRDILSGISAGPNSPSCFGFSRRTDFMTETRKLCHRESIDEPRIGSGMMRVWCHRERRRSGMRLFMTLEERLGPQSSDAVARAAVERQCCVNLGGRGGGGGLRGVRGDRHPAHDAIALLGAPQCPHRCSSDKSTQRGRWSGWGPTGRTLQNLHSKH